MHDQAESLRRLVRQHGAETGKSTRMITVTSGKGGVGKSNFTLNFALQLQARGKKVIIFDADIGMANIDVLMGASSSYSLYHLLNKEKTIWDIIHQGVNGIEYIAGGSGFRDLLRLTEEDLQHFMNQVNELNGYADYILFDTGAGLSKETFQFIIAAEDAIIVTTPEPTSITDAYAVIKLVHMTNPDVRYRLVVNRATDDKEGQQTAQKISLVAQRFLQIDVPVLGFMPDDAFVSKAVKKQVPFTVAYPRCAASLRLSRITDHFLTGQAEVGQQAGVKSFFQKVLRLMK